MKSLRKTLLWLLLLAMAGVAGGGMYCYQLWQRGDELLSEQLLARLREIGPQWNMSLARTRLDYQGRIHAYGFQLNAPDGVLKFLDIPEAIITIDKERLIEDKPQILNLRLLQPTVYVVRRGDGTWIWQGIPPPRSTGQTFEWNLEEATVHVRLEATADAPPATTLLKNLRVRLIPAGHEEFLIEIDGPFPLAEQVQLRANWNLEKRVWELRGSLKDVQFGPPLVALLAAGSEDFRDSCRQVDTWLAEHGGSGLPLPGAVATAPPAMNTPARPPAGSAESWGLTALLDVDFRIKQWQPGAECEYSVNFDLKQGAFSNSALPFPLQDLRGICTCDNRQIQIQRLTARNAATRFSVEGKIEHQGMHFPTDLALSVSNLPLDSQLRGFLPVSLQRVYDSLRPTGNLDVIVQLLHPGRGQWDFASDITLHQGTVRHLRFAYPVEQIEGTLKQRGEIVDLNFTGQAGSRPVQLRGRIKNPGPEAESILELQTNQLPLDERFRAACPPKILKTLDLLQLQGKIDAQLLLKRAAGREQPTIPYLTARITGGTVRPLSFPYTLREVSGILKGVGENDWTFLNLRGKHEDGTVTGSGRFAPNQRGEPQLDLTLDGAAIPLDAQLYTALPASSQALYTELNPAGLATLRSHVLWSPGQPADVEVSARITQGSFSIKSFPFALDDVRAELFLGKGRVVIKSLTGKHDDTRVQFTAEGDYVPGDEWRIRLENLLVEHLEPDRRFRKTLPARLREVFETLDPRGRLTVRGMLEFRGTSERTDPVTAAWDLNTIYSGATLTPGVDLENLHGAISLRGTWDGEQVSSAGNLKLDSVTVKGHQFTQIHGPFRIRGTELILGSEKAIKGNADPAIAARTPPQEQITANFIDGKLYFDGLAMLNKQTTYFVHMNLRDARLEKYAALYLPGRNQLRGIVNGWVNLNGHGATAQSLSGRGLLQISPAALYELPIIVQLFKVLSLAPLNKTAFKHALMEFDVGGKQFLVRRLELVGDAVSLRGHGTVKFNGETQLDFYSMMPKHQLPIPIVREVVGEATKGWVGVQIRGPMSNPQATIRAVPQLDNALRTLLGGGDPQNSPGAPPPLLRSSSRGFLQF